MSQNIYWTKAVSHFDSFENHIDSPEGAEGLKQALYAIENISEPLSMSQNNLISQYFRCLNQWAKYRFVPNIETPIDLIYEYWQAVDGYGDYDDNDIFHFKRLYVAAITAEFPRGPRTWADALKKTKELSDEEIVKVIDLVGPYIYK